MAARDNRLDRASTLFGQLFGRDSPHVLERLSDGIGAILGNAEILLDEAAILTGAKRYERAEFLVATAEEEMGKVYILADMCRLDFSRKEDVLRRLCRAFYDHVHKYVYFDLSAHRYAGIWELAHVRNAFVVAARRWWPGSTEDGEPDMPHDTYFLREANLYVDFDGFSGTWMVPRQPAKSILFQPPFPSLVDTARAALQKILATQQLGLFRADALRIFNRCMKQLCITERTTTDDLIAIYQQTAKDLEEVLGVAPQAFHESQLRNWPLYWITPESNRR